MGGCRCTYRNCTVRTDGTTHMFHYPVFDKVRCHQWLTNAHKLEFLNLKVSQLKNRVICQHHFKLECFMNFKKDKLTFEAVPTLDGPFCDPGQYGNNTSSQDETKIYPISLDDIENEYLTLYDKKANFSVKYGDFLTNCELMDMGSIDPVNNSKSHVLYRDKQKKVKNIEEPHVINLNDNVDKLPYSTTLNVLPNKSSIIPEDTQTHLDLVLAGYTLIQPKILDVEFDGLQSNSNNQSEKTSKHDNNDETQTIQKDDNVSHQTKKDILQSTRVKILSEKKISEPVSLSGKLQPVSPSLILRLPDKRSKKTGPENVGRTKTKHEIKAAYMNILNNSTENMLSRKGVPNINEKAENRAGCINILNSNIENVSSSKEVPVIEINKEDENKAEYINILNNTENVASSKEAIVSKARNKVENKSEYINILNINSEKVSSSKEVRIAVNEKQLNKNCGQGNQKILKNKVSNGISSKKSLLKPKINQVRVAAIKEKRKFNMKLRDIIESCLDKMEDQERGQTENNTNPKNENVGTFLSKDTALPSEQEYTIACLDARMKRMEEVLLNKIDQNTQRIIELKNSVLTSTKKSACTQTTSNQESHKKNLYKEISKYLSANVNSLIYEELFINKYAQSSSQDTSSPKRRKRR